MKKESALPFATKNLTWHHGKVTPEWRAGKLSGQGAVIWLTGLSCSGKSTIARELESELVGRGINAVVLDGDNIRQGLNKDLGFSPADRTENIRRIGEVSKLFADNNVIAIVAFISPYRADRAAARARLPAGRFIEVYCAAPLDACEKRDAKGLYAKARAGQILEFTGITAPYEPPEKPEIVLHTDQETVRGSVENVLDFLEKHKIFRQPRRKK